MASPHSAGAVALLWSCNPALIGQMDVTFEALQNSADSSASGYCGAPPDGEGDYRSGYGFLNVYSAGLESCLPPHTGELEGHVTEDGSGDPIEDAHVVAFPETPLWGPVGSYTNSAGYYRMEVPVGSFRIVANSSVHHAEWVSGVSVGEDELVEQDFELIHLDSWCDQFTCFYLPTVVKH